MSEIQSENHRKTDIKSMDLAELKAFMTSIGEKPFRASQIYQWMHVRHVSSWDEMTNLSKALQGKVKRAGRIDGLRAGDHSDIETGWNQKISVSSAGWKYDRERADAL